MNGYAGDIACEFALLPWAEQAKSIFSVLTIVLEVKEIYKPPPLVIYDLITAVCTVPWHERVLGENLKREHADIAVICNRPLGWSASVLVLNLAIRNAHRRPADIRQHEDTYYHRKQTCNKTHHLQAVY